MSKKNAVLLVVIVILAFSLRMFCVVKSAGATLSGDEPSYDSIARNLLEGHGYSLGYSSHPSPTATRGPAYVFLVAAIYSIFGADHSNVRVAQVVLDCLCCLLLFKICTRLFRRTDTALVAALIYAVYPPFIMNTRYILTETLTLLLTTLSICLFLEAALTKRKGFLYAAALVTGAAALSKPILAVLPVLVFFAGIGGKERLILRAKSLAVGLVLTGLVMSPWIARNVIVFHSFIPGVSQGGFTFWGGTGPAEGRVLGGLDGPYTPKHVKPAIRGLSEIERDRWFYREGIRVVKEHPARYLWVMIKKVPRLWFNLAKEEDCGTAIQTLRVSGIDTSFVSRINAVFAAGNLLAIALAILGIVRVKPPRISVCMLVWLVVYFTAIHMVFYAVFRYSLPVYAYIFCFTAAGMTSLFSRHKRGIELG